MEEIEDAAPAPTKSVPKPVAQAHSQADQSLLDEEELPADFNRQAAADLSRDSSRRGGDDSFVSIPELPTVSARPLPTAQAQPRPGTTVLAAGRRLPADESSEDDDDRPPPRATSFAQQKSGPDDARPPSRGSKEQEAAATAFSRKISNTSNGSSTFSNFSLTDSTVSHAQPPALAHQDALPTRQTAPYGRGRADEDEDEAEDYDGLLSRKESILGLGLMGPPPAGDSQAPPLDEAEEKDEEETAAARRPSVLARLRQANTFSLTSLGDGESDGGTPQPSPVKAARSDRKDPPARPLTAIREHAADEFDFGPPAQSAAPAAHPAGQSSAFVPLIAGREPDNRMPPAQALAQAQPAANGPSRMMSTDSTATNLTAANSLYLTEEQEGEPEVFESISLESPDKRPTPAQAQTQGQPAPAEHKKFSAAAKGFLGLFSKRRPSQPAADEAAPPAPAAPAGPGPNDSQPAAALLPASRSASPALPGPAPDANEPAARERSNSKNGPSPAPAQSASSSGHGLGLFSRVTNAFRFTGSAANSRNASPARPDHSAGPGDANPNPNPSSGPAQALAADQKPPASRMARSLSGRIELNAIDETTSPNPSNPSNPGGQPLPSSRSASPAMARPAAFPSLQEPNPSNPSNPAPDLVAGPNPAPGAISSSSSGPAPAASTSLKPPSHKKPPQGMSVAAIAQMKLLARQHPPAPEEVPNPAPAPVTAPVAGPPAPANPSPSPATLPQAEEKGGAGMGIAEQRLLLGDLATDEEHAPAERKTSLSPALGLPAPARSRYDQPAAQLSASTASLGPSAPQPQDSRPLPQLPPAQRSQSAGRSSLRFSFGSTQPAASSANNGPAPGRSSPSLRSSSRPRFLSGRGLAQRIRRNPAEAVEGQRPQTKSGRLDSLAAQQNAAASKDRLLAVLGRSQQIDRSLAVRQSAAELPAGLLRRHKSPADRLVRDLKALGRHHPAAEDDDEDAAVAERKGERAARPLPFSLLFQPASEDSDEPPSGREGPENPLDFLAAYWGRLKNSTQPASLFLTADDRAHFRELIGRSMPKKIPAPALDPAPAHPINPSSPREVYEEVAQFRERVRLSKRSALVGDMLSLLAEEKRLGRGREQPVHFIPDPLYGLHLFNTSLFSSQLPEFLSQQQHEEDRDPAHAHAHAHPATELLLTHQRYGLNPQVVHNLIHLNLFHSELQAVLAVKFAGHLGKRLFSRNPAAGRRFKKRFFALVADPRRNPNIVGLAATSGLTPRELIGRTLAASPLPPGSSSDRPQYLLAEFRAEAESAWGAVPLQLKRFYPLADLLFGLVASDGRKEGREFTLCFRLEPAASPRPLVPLGPDGLPVQLPLPDGQAAPKTLAEEEAAAALVAVDGAEDRAARRAAAGAVSSERDELPEEAEGEAEEDEDGEFFDFPDEQSGLDAAYYYRPGTVLQQQPGKGAGPGQGQGQEAVKELTYRALTSARRKERDWIKLTLQADTSQQRVQWLQLLTALGPDGLYVNTLNYQ